MRKLLIGVAVLAVLLVAADRISVAVAENQISDRLASAYGLPGKPGVSITGFPFLTQVAAGDYRQIDVSASQVPADGATLHDLKVRLSGVHATVGQVLGSGSSMVTADRAAGSAMVGFGTVDRRLPGGLRLHPDGKNLSVSGRLAFHGAHIPVSATVAVLRVTPSSSALAWLASACTAAPNGPAHAAPARWALRSGRPQPLPVAWPTRCSPS